MTPPAPTDAFPTNRLRDATSPYLLQHAHNPVDWYPWGPEALEKARREDMPLFVSIGYSACHWCHVMERESFENPDTAAVLNAHFVPVKVDREERPDLDEIYMRATVLYNRGHGGWPMSVFCTPDGRPFFAGTYFPPEPRYGMPAFRDLLLEIARLWRQQRERVDQAAAGLTDALQRLSAGAGTSAGRRGSIVDAALTLAAAFDPREGGILSGATNKFPPSLAVGLMLRAWDRTRRAGAPDRRLLDPVVLTLEKMLDGGIYDHLGGGIARYSTDPHWLVPHFEKMLYDQALVGGALIDASLVTGRERFLRGARHILDYVLADLQAPEGGFYSARDADSEGVEGRYYVWSKAEVMSRLGPELGTLFCEYYDVTEAGNWEGHNILHIRRDLETLAAERGLKVDQARHLLAEARRRLLEARTARVPPALDDKILTAWNGLMISTLARAGRAAGEPGYIRAAGRAADFLLSIAGREGRLLRTYRAGKAHTPAYLEDYAFLVEGLLDLYESTFDPAWLDRAARLNDDMVRLFHDDGDGGFFQTACDAEPLVIRPRDLRDGAIPAGASVAAMNLLRLASMLDRPDLEKLAARTIGSFAGQEASPFGFERMLAAADLLEGRRCQVVVVGALSDAQTQALIAALNRDYDPGRMVLHLDPASPGAEDLCRRIGPLRGKTPVHGRPAAYVCFDGTCRPPATGPDELLRQLQDR